jgi:hypothetical protein
MKSKGHKKNKLSVSFAKWTQIYKRLHVTVIPRRKKLPIARSGVTAMQRPWPLAKSNEHQRLCSGVKTITSSITV